jgi:SAM-dependent methyltransferase
MGKGQDIPYQYEPAVYNLDAPREVVPIIAELTRPDSVLDVGCGTGTWLKAFEELGINDVVGLDGEHVENRLLEISYEKFRMTDLRQPFALGRKFGLVLCLEVAEHLPEDVATEFVGCLTAHADVIVFSAAIPGQGGQFHVNEQWPAYWAEKFARRGFYFHDVIRSRIWNNARINWWYRQNIFLVTREKGPAVMPLIHPECFTSQVAGQKRIFRNAIMGGLGPLESLKIFLRSITRRSK